MKLIWTQTRAAVADSVRRSKWSSLAALASIILISLFIIACYAPIEVHQKALLVVATDFVAEEVNATPTLIDRWFRCPQLDAPPIESIGVNLSVRCPANVWVRPIQQRNTTPLSRECLERCLDSMCCASFRSLSDTSCELSQLRTPPASQQTGTSWFEVLGDFDRREIFPSHNSEPRLVLFRGPPKYIQPAPDGRWRGTEIELHVVDPNGDIVHAQGGARVTLSRRIPGGVDWIYELVEFDVFDGTIARRFESRLPEFVSEKTTYVVTTLFAPHKRGGTLKQSLELEFEFTQMPPPVAVQPSFLAFTRSGLSVMKFTFLDGKGQTTWPSSSSANGNSLVSIRHATAAASQTAQLVHGEVIIAMPCTSGHETSTFILRAGESEFVTQEFHCSIGKPTEPANSRIAVSISFKVPPTAPSCLFCDVPHAIRRRLVVMTCFLFICGEADDMTCLAPQGERCHLPLASEYLQHYHHLQTAHRHWKSLSLNAVFMMEASAYTTAAVEALVDSVLGHQNVTLWSTQFAAPHALRDVGVWNLPSDSDHDAYIRQESWWPHVAGMPAMSAWLMSRGRFVVSPACLQNTQRCVMAIHTERALRAVLDDLLPMAPGATVAESACLSFASFIVMVMTTLG